MRLGATVDLLSQFPHEDVDGAVTVALAPPPELLQELVPAHHPSGLARERIQEAKLRGRQPGACSTDERLHLARVDPQLLDLDRRALVGPLGPRSPPGRGCDTATSSFIENGLTR